ncbi:DUF4097 domain-containing protein [Cerasibacillus terrae]|uniref:DUF4097 domain-containing protein n=1 Tax=Cerasibacillus terrae TaxID=2498845 RepID=A0A5C8NVD1_9BACI|nr:DUF4097 family beta strand repeat-containing protein [Cerasibacillus terrae]TXL65096.1 DUF4097 domain-containing protein [Cerasibacillus terrae]
MLKKLVMVASVLLIIGIVGSLFNFKTLYSDKEMKEEKIIDTVFDTINISVDSAKIELIPTNEKNAILEYRTNYSDYNFSSEVKNSTLEVHVDMNQKKLFRFDFFSKGSALKLYIPKKQYESLQIESDNGRIMIEEIDVKTADIRTDNGRIEINNMASDNLTANSNNGRINLANVDASTVTTKSSNGKIVLNHVTGTLSSKTNNGSISLITEDLERSIDFKTDNGKIEIQTEKEPTNVIFDLKTDNGSIDVFNQSDWDTVIGNGDNTIKLETDNGKIIITK